MDIKEILKGYLTIEVVDVKDGIYQLGFKNGINSNCLSINSIVDFIGLPIHQRYFDLFSTDLIEMNSAAHFTIGDSYLKLEKRRRRIELFTTDGLSRTSVYEDLKKFKDDYDTWLESYLDDISPALQKKMDTVLPKGFGKDEVNLLLSKI